MAFSEWATSGSVALVQAPRPGFGGVRVRANSAGSPNSRPTPGPVESPRAVSGWAGLVGPSGHAQRGARGLLGLLGLLARPTAEVDGLESTLQEATMEPLEPPSHHLTGSVLPQALGTHSQPSAIRPPSLAGASLPPSRAMGQPFGPLVLLLLCTGDLCQHLKKTSERPSSHTQFPLGCPSRRLLTPSGLVETLVTKPTVIPQRPRKVNGTEGPRESGIGDYLTLAESTTKKTRDTPKSLSYYLI